MWSGFTDGEHEIRKPKHMWTDDDLEPVQVMDTETREVTTMTLDILEQENVKFKLEFEPMHQEMECQVQKCQMLLISRRMKGWRELEAKHEATVSENAPDDQKLRMNSEFKAICMTDETRLWSMKYSDRQDEHLREMHVRDSAKNRMAKQCTGDEGCLCLDLVESKKDTSTFKLCDPESILRELKNKCLHIEWKIVSSCCRMLIGLETSRIVAVILKPQKTLGSGLDFLIFGSVLVMTDDSYAKNFGVAWCDPRGCAEDRLSKPQNTSRNERRDITSLYTKVRSVTSQELELQIHGRHVP